MNEQYSPYSGGKPASYNAFSESLERRDVSAAHLLWHKKEPEEY